MAENKDDAKWRTRVKQVCGVLGRVLEKTDPDIVHVSIENKKIRSDHPVPKHRKGDTPITVIPTPKVMHMLITATYKDGTQRILLKNPTVGNATYRDQFISVMEVGSGMKAVFEVLKYMDTDALVAAHIEMRTSPGEPKQRGF